MNSTMHRGTQNERNAALAVTGLGLEPTWDNSLQSEQEQSSNILYIAVGYVKDDDFKLESDGNISQDQTTNYPDFEDHVSPLDPNMSSVARYSPVYTENTSYNNPVIITQLISNGTTNQNENFIGNNLNEVTALSSIDLQQAIVNARYLQMVDEQNSLCQDGVPENLAIMQDREQEVELLITDQSTGISYISTQEYLVERCLTDEHELLESLSPDPLLDNDLLNLEESSLKTQLEIIEGSNQKTIKYENHEGFNKNFLQKGIEFLIPENEEQQLLSCVQSISDKPVPSRARATLPESHLIIDKKNDEYCVIAKKFIAKATQFGPLEGVFNPEECVKIESNKLDLKVEMETGEIFRLDISDENTSNWMCFVRRATNFEEQNLVLMQLEKQLYYVSIKNIHPKQELLVGYSSSYAKKYNLPLLQQIEQKLWQCFECSSCFDTKELLRNHKCHNKKERDENVKPKKSLIRKRLLLKKSDPLECIKCNTVFSSPKYSFLRHHVLSHGICDGASIQDYFRKVRKLKCEICNELFSKVDDYNFHLKTHKENDKLQPQKEKRTDEKPLRCPACYKIFASQERMKRHLLIHASEDSKPFQCDKCLKKFLSSSALACHRKSHITGRKIFECPICNESFNHILQLKRHIVEHCIDGKYTCPFCSKIFTKYSVIRKHIRAFHCEKKHYCTECTKVFPTVDKLKMHLLRHSDHREFLCADCGKQFKRKDKLNEHCKRIHSEERSNLNNNREIGSKKFTPKVQPTDYHRFIYKCHTCLVGFKRRGMLVNHLAKRHPEISLDTVPELNLPILRTTRDYYCQYCDKVYRSSSKRKAHILKNHPGAQLPISNRKLGANTDPNPSYTQTVGSITTHPQSCKWCHKQYASKAKLLQHQRKKHADKLNKLMDNNEENASDDIKVSDLINNMVTLRQDRNVEQYYQLVSITGVDEGINKDENFSGDDSRLYNLLTTNSSMDPPR